MKRKSSSVGDTLSSSLSSLPSPPSSPLLPLSSFLDDHMILDPSDISFDHDSSSLHTDFNELFNEESNSSFHSSQYGGSLRVAILNSLKGYAEDNNQGIESSSLKSKKTKNRKKFTASNSLMLSRPRLQVTPSTSYSLWTSPPQGTPAANSSFHFLPLELLFEFIASYLTLTDISNLRCSCCYLWNTLTQYSHRNSLIPLCQGEYTALCQPIAMLKAKEFQQCGLARPKWEHEHNGLCQLCGHGQLDIFDCYCYTCNVSYHRVCLDYHRNNNRNNGGGGGGGDIDLVEGAGLGTEVEDVESGEDDILFLCEECLNVQETPVSGFPLLLPPRTSVSRHPIRSPSSISPQTSSSVSTFPTASTKPPPLSYSSTPSPTSSLSTQSEDHLPLRTTASSSSSLLSMRCSLRVALRNSLLETAEHTPIASSSSSSSSACLEKKQTRTRPASWWEHSSSHSHPISFRVVGGFNSSNVAPSRGIYEFTSSTPSPSSQNSKNRNRSSSRSVPDPKWRYTEYGSLPSHLPTIHSNMSVVISSDRLDHHSYCVWAFPQLRDHPNHRLSPETRMRRDISFDLASILTVLPPSQDQQEQEQAKGREDEAWCWKDQELGGNIPPPRVSAALCYSNFLGAIIVHGGLTMVTRISAVAEAAATAGGGGGADAVSMFVAASTFTTSSGGSDEMIQAPAGAAYLPTEALYCLPISHALSLPTTTVVVTAAAASEDSKMKTRQSTSGLSTPSLRCPSFPLSLFFSLSLIPKERDSHDLPVRVAHSPPSPAPAVLDVNCWREMAPYVDASIGIPSARHGHTMTEIGSQLWIFGGMGYESLDTSKVPKRRQLNDLYVLDLSPLLLSKSSNDSSRESSSSKKMQWVKPLTRGPGPPRRAGHSAMAMGCQLLIFGGANGNRYLSDLFIFHTPTSTWSSVMLTPSPSHGLSPTQQPDPHEDGDSSSPRSWGQIISKRIKPALLPISPNQFILFGGGKVCDFSAPTFGAIPTDCYLIQLSPATAPCPPLIAELGTTATVTAKRRRVRRK